jgi:hypothetical protein
MATDRKKIMVFKDGPEEGKELEWKIDESAPPPTAHAVVDKRTIAVYSRNEIQPYDNQIDYIYVLKKYTEG